MHRNNHQVEKYVISPSGTTTQGSFAMSKKEEVGRDERSCSSIGESLSNSVNSHMAELLQEIPIMKQLQWEVVDSQIEARQIMRKVGQKRSDVSRADDSFMKELQRLQAEGHLEAFKELSRLANYCQSVRDGLGVLEAEGIEAQQKIERCMWDLRQVEDKIVEILAYVFGEADEESSVASDSNSAHDILEIRSPAEGGMMRQQEPSTTSLPMREILKELTVDNSRTREPLPHGDKSKEEQKDLLLLDLDLKNRVSLGNQKPQYKTTLSLQPEALEPIDRKIQPSEPSRGSDSGASYLDRIDHALQKLSVTTKQHSSTESFPNLLTQFGTRRDRINKWLLHTMLISKSQANLIGLQLEKEPDSSPSPWAQLIVAYLEFDSTTSKLIKDLGSKDANTEERDPASEIPQIPHPKTREH
ncbi:hypothetical protein NHQ30_011255 [Ciborinia camelliae]|nr:hypothetical protein NHQ30_011255 [Ciborinia camelliae]